MPQMLTEHFIFSLSPWVCVWSYCNCAANGMFCISHILSKQTNKKATNMVLMFLNRLNTSWFVLWICNQIIAVVQLDFPPFLFDTKREKKKWLNCLNTAVLEKCEYELRCLRNAKPNDLNRLNTHILQFRHKKSRIETTEDAASRFQQFLIATWDCATVIRKITWGNQL